MSASSDILIPSFLLSKEEELTNNLCVLGARYSTSINKHVASKYDHLVDHLVDHCNDRCIPFVSWTNPEVLNLWHGTKIITQGSNTTTIIRVCFRRRCARNGPNTAISEAPNRLGCFQNPARERREKLVQYCGSPPTKMIFSSPLFQCGAKSAFLQTLQEHN